VTRGTATLELTKPCSSVRYFEQGSEIVFLPRSSTFLVLRDSHYAEQLGANLKIGDTVAFLMLPPFDCIGKSEIFFAGGTI
jgi:hypothetical protein